MSPALVELRDIRVRRNGTTVLDGVSFTLRPGERLAIVGPNGAGKTTLLRTIMGLERAESGSVALFGHACSAEQAFRTQRPRIGFLFQDSDDQLFCPTVIEDVAFGPLNTGCTMAEAFGRAREVLAALRLGHLADRIVHRLSGGEKRLVCLAGLFAMHPDVLLLGEPTNGVDEAHAAMLRDELRRFSGAMIIVSHDAEFVADLASRAMILSAGQLAAAEIHDHPHLHTHPHLHPRQAGWQD